MKLTRFRDSKLGRFLSRQQFDALPPERTQTETVSRIPWWAKLNGFGRPAWLERLDTEEIACEIDVVFAYSDPTRARQAAKRIRSLLNARAEGWMPGHSWDEGRTPGYLTSGVPRV